MLRFKRGFVEFDDAGKQERIAFEQLHAVAFAVAPAVEKRAVSSRFAVVPKLLLDEPQILLRRHAVFFIAQNGEPAQTRRASGRSTTRESCRPDAGGRVWRARRAFLIWRRRATHVVSVAPRSAVVLPAKVAKCRVSAPESMLKTFCPGNGCGWLWSTKLPFVGDAEEFRGHVEFLR